MEWNLEGKFVKAMYISEIPVYGKVCESRVAFGGQVKHSIQLLEKLVLFETERTRVVVEAHEIVAVM